MEVFFFLLALHLIRLTGPGNQVIELNVENIVSLREPRSAEHFFSGANCLINTTDGKIVVVQERCDAVTRMIEEQKQ